MKNLPESLKLLCPPTVKCRSFQILPVIVKNSFCLKDTFQLHKHQLFFLFMHNMHKRQRSSGKFRLYKYLLYDKRTVEHAMLLFSVFSFLQHWHAFCQKGEFSSFYYVTKFLEFRFSRICANGYCSIVNWGYTN